MSNGMRDFWYGKKQPASPYGNLYRSAAPTTWDVDGQKWIGWQNAPNAQTGYTQWKMTGNTAYDKLRAQWLSAMNQYGQHTPEAERRYRQLQQMDLTGQNTAQTMESKFPNIDEIIAKITETSGKAFDVGGANLRQQQASSVAQANRAFGAQAAARGLANPIAAGSAVASQVRSPFTRAFGQLEQGRATAATGIAQYEADLKQSKAKYDEAVRQFNETQDMRYYQIAMQELQYQRDLDFRYKQTQAGIEDYVGMLLGGFGSWLGGRT
jgi:hypothetical protein